MAANGNVHNIDPNVQIIVNDFLCAQLLLKGYEWTPTVEENNGNVVMEASMRTKVGDALRALGQAYVNLYQQNFAEMLQRLQLSPNVAFATFQSVSNELYIEGIKWSHIITHLVFASEFALNCAQQGYPHLVDEVAQWLALYINQHLLQWITDHGGWVCVWMCLDVLC